jgi:signal transduction histidine kinase
MDDSLINALPDGVIVLDEHGGILTCNPAAARLVGRDRSELIGSPMGEPLHPGEPQEIQTRSADGTTRTYESIASPLPAEHRPGHWIVSLRDTSRRSAHEKQLIQYQQRLRKLAHEATTAAATERRRVADLMHDQVQHLLVAARMQMQRLSTDASGGSAVHDAIAALDEAMQTTRSFTTDLVPPLGKHADLCESIRWAIGLMRRRHGLNVAFDPPDDGCLIEHEPTRVALFTMVRELLFNVVKHGGTQRATVDVLKLTPTLVQIRVSDNGHGFEPGTLEDRDDEETHLGLFRIREQIEFLGGAFRLQTRPGEGTRITLSIPLQDTDTPPLAPVPVAEAAAATPKPSPRDDGAAPVNGVARVLWVDDNERLRSLLVRRAQQHPRLQVIAEVGSGEQAIEQAARLGPDVVVMDISLPGIDGLEATRRLTAAHPGIRVVGLTCHHPDHLVGQMKDAGGEVILDKAAAVDELLDRLANGHGTGA